MMKKLLLLILIWSNLLLSAQIRVTLNVSSHPSPQISDWQNHNETAVLTVTNSDPNREGDPYKISAQIYLDNRLIAETKFNEMPQMQLPLGTDTFFAEDIIPFRALNIHEQQGERATIIRTGMLPAGNYRFCVQLVDLENHVISMPERVCKPMIITDYHMPELISPFNNQEITSVNAQNIIFRWTPISPMPPAQQGVKYIVTVAEVQNGQTPQQAFLSNRPIIEEEVMASTQLYMATTNVNTINASLPGNTPIQYVWSVKPVRLDGTPYSTANNGFVPFFTYTIRPTLIVSGNNNQVTPNNSGNATVKDTTTQQVNKVFYVGANGEFEVKVNRWRKNNDKYTGTGLVHINWLKTSLKVTFDEIQLDSLNKLKDGKVFATIDPTAIEYPKMWHTKHRKNWKNKSISDMTKWIDAHPNRVFVYKGTTANPNMQLPIATLINHQKLALTEMYFSSSDAYVNLVISKSLPPSWELKDLGYFGWRIPFHTDGLVMNKLFMRLSEDVMISAGGKDKIEFKFKKCKGRNLDGTYLKFYNDSIGYTTVVDAQLPLTWMHKPKKKNEKINVSLTGKYINWKSIILKGKLPEAIIPNTEGLKIEANEINFDLSDISNPKDMSFPSGYPNQNVHFMGFYAKLFKLTLPEAWKKKDESPVSFMAKNMIIDKNGISVDINAKNIITIKKGKVADLAGSLDEANFNIKMNKFTEAWVRGKIVLPVSNPKEKDNFLKYKALFHIAKDTTDHTRLLLTVQAGKIRTEFLEGKMDINKNSKIYAYLGTDKRLVNINLNGKFYWEKKNATKEEKNKNILTINFQNLSFKMDSSNKKKPLEFKNGNWSFASPQKKVKGYEVSIKKIYYHSKTPSSADQLVNGELRFDAIFNLSKDIGAKATFGIGSSISKVDGWYLPKYEGFSLSKATVNINNPTVSFKGSLDVFNQDFVYGDGFKSEIDVKFKPIKVTAKALVQFGNTNYKNTDNTFYRYWRVEAQATFPKAIPFLPGLGFRGFGGGAYYNMQPIEKTVTGKKTYIFKPNKGDWGLKAKAIIATMPKDEVFNADISLKADVTKHDGLKKIAFLGEFYVGAGLEKRSKAHAKGKVNLDYDIPNEHFNMGANLSFDLKLVKGSNLNFQVDINGKSDSWMIKLGEPKHINQVVIFPKTLNRRIGEYLMVGNKIPTPTGFSAKYKAAYKDILGKEPGFKSPLSSVNQKAALGQGFSFGVNFMFNTKGDTIFKKIKVLGYSPGIKYQIAAGAELFGSLMQYKTGCAGYYPVGINGWRAQAGLSVFGRIALAGAIYDAKKYNKVFDFNLADLSVGAWVQGEFPHPSYVAGKFEGKVKVLFFDFDFEKDFKYGKQCKGLKSDNGTKVKYHNVLTDVSKNKLIESIYPANNTNGLQIDAPVEVKYGLVPGEVFTIAEQQKNGTIKNRTFRLVVHTKLKTEKFGMLHEEAMSSTVNNLGEYEYQLKNPPVNNQGIGQGVGTYADNVGNFADGTQNGCVYPPQVQADVPHVAGNSTFGNGAPVRQGGMQYQSNTTSGGPMAFDNSDISNNLFDLDLYQNYNSTIAKPKWKSDTMYLFEVEAELQELMPNHKWMRAAKNTYEKQVIKFRTVYVQPQSNVMQPIR